MRSRPVLLSIALMLLAGTAGASDGLVPPDSRDVWPQWQARITVASSTLSRVSLTDPAAPQRGAPQLGALLGDYYFNMPGLRLPASVGGLRATGGLLSGTRGLSLTPPAALRDASADATVAYLGVGYTGQALKGRWGITADLGLAAESTGNASRPGRAMLGTQGFDNATRELRLSPVLQLGVSYAF